MNKRFFALSAAIISLSFLPACRKKDTCCETKKEKVCQTHYAYDDCDNMCDYDSCDTDCAACYQVDAKTADIHFTDNTDDLDRDTEAMLFEDDSIRIV